MTGQKTAVPSDALILASEKEVEDLLQEDSSSSRSSLSVSRYLAQFKGYPVLTDALEIDAVYERYHYGWTEHERRRAYKELLYGNIRLVVKIAFGFRSRGMPLLDLIQEGVIGLGVAIDRYAPDHEFTFSTYAVHWIRQAMRRAIHDKDYKKPMRLPVNMLESQALFYRVEAKFECKHQRKPTNRELLNELKSVDSVGAQATTLERIAKVRSGTIHTSVSFEQPLSRDGSDERTLGDMIADPHTPVDTVLDVKRFAKQALAFLDETRPKRDVEIFCLRHGLRGNQEELTLDQIGAQFGLTRERVRQIIEQNLDKLARKFRMDAAKSPNEAIFIQALESHLSDE